MSARTLFAKDFAAKNKARADNARLFRTAVVELATRFLALDAKHTAELKRLEQKGFALGLSVEIAVPMGTEPADFAEPVDAFIEELEMVEPADVMADANELDAQEEDDE